MSPKQRNLLIAGTALLGMVLYAYVYRGAFSGQNIEINHRIIVGPPVRGTGRTNLALKVTQLVFGLDQKYRLTEIKVIPVAALKTNANPLPTWHLVSESNSIPVRLFAYGDHMRGLHPLVKKSRALPLEAKVSYRLLLKAGRDAGQCDFTVDQTITPFRWNGTNSPPLQ